MGLEIVEPSEDLINSGEVRFTEDFEVVSGLSFIEGTIREEEPIQII